MRRWLSSVRARAALGATLVVGVAAVIAAISFVAVLRSALTDSVRDSAEITAAAAAAAYERGDAVTGNGLDDDVVIEVVAPGSAPGGPPFERAVSAREATQDGGAIVVWRSLEDVDEATRVAAWSLAIGIPVLLLVVAGTTWWVTGRALRPVEAVRAEVEAVSGSELHRRVPVPATDDEIQRLAATMNRMLDRLEQSQQQQRQFVSDASHELRSPIASIRQHAEVALAHPQHSDLGDLASTVLAEDLRLQRIVDDLLLLARADENQLRPTPVEVDLDDVVLAQAQTLRTDSGLVVSTADVHAARVSGDVALLTRLVDNLGSNARRHARGRVVVTLDERDCEVVLRIDDDGAGIPVGDRERVLERFVRLDDARARDAGGSGLGLAIVDEIARAHGGSVQIGEAEIGGARIEVHLPAGEPAARSGPRQVAGATVDGTITSTAGG
jgi:signal transduction histidine kinase